MTDLTINIDDYLGEEEKRQIARDEFRAACAGRSAADFERILSNAAYDLVRKEVDDAFEGDMVATVRANALRVIRELSSFTVFNRPNAWDTESSKGWKYLQEAIEAAKPVMAERVLAIIAEMDGDDLRGRLDGLIGDVIVSKLTAPAGVEA
ncbi:MULTISPECIES: hypothetical protein [Achromobacter]|uniref:Uncharacterized protein n=1 Tax=Alcaligenes xylosoxydans xylosoxydans TaxID=85698 RepID=A0A1R1JTF0_ALCXX|nr:MULTISPECIES: hypothetical protein [Achromobacter]OMG87652.1 hypothetical protein BIZ92_08500 [Achromobacter xylosoxidans]BEG74469.1 hypothetical protein HBIAX_01516 [Achromobacter xylosoxidans]